MIQTTAREIAICRKQVTGKLEVPERRGVWSESVGQKVAHTMETRFGTPIICPVLIGRAAELATLHQLIDQTKDGRGQVALLSGEAGIGKSRLVAEAGTVQ